MREIKVHLEKLLITFPSSSLFIQLQMSLTDARELSPSFLFSLTSSSHYIFSSLTFFSVIFFSLPSLSNSLSSLFNQVELVKFDWKKLEKKVGNERERERERECFMLIHLISFYMLMMSEDKKEEEEKEEEGQGEVFYFPPSHLSSFG